MSRGRERDRIGRYLVGGTLTHLTSVGLESWSGGSGVSSAEKDESGSIGSNDMTGF
jgi:hypothetical protein